MIDEKMIEMLRCPIDGNRLEMAEKSVTQRLNDAIKRGELRDRMDQKITRELDATLVNHASNRAYPIRGGIPSLVADEAMDLISEVP